MHKWLKSNDEYLLFNVSIYLLATAAITLLLVLLKHSYFSAVNQGKATSARENLKEL